MFSVLSSFLPTVLVPWFRIIVNRLWKKTKWLVQRRPVSAKAMATNDLRVAGITMTITAFETILQPEDQMEVLWGILDRCVVPAEQRTHARRFGSDNNNNNLTAALMVIDVKFSFMLRPSASILEPLTSKYPALTRSLQTLKIAFNDCDESAALGAFAALATGLQELTFVFCNLTSVQGLAGSRCEYLRRVNFSDCHQLGSITGLKEHMYLEVVDATYTAITNIEPLATCPSLTKVDLSFCQQLSSIEPLRNHRWLQEVNVSHTPITSIEPLRSCPALTKAVLFCCRQLTSLEALEGHQWLQEIDIALTAVTSIEPLRACPALKSVRCKGCQKLPIIDVDYLPASVKVIQ